jgi:hypothetical protein
VSVGALDDVSGSEHLCVLIDEGGTLVRNDVCDVSHYLQIFCFSLIMNQ